MGGGSTLAQNVKTGVCLENYVYLEGWITFRLSVEMIYHSISLNSFMKQYILDAKQYRFENLKVFIYNMKIFDAEIIIIN